MLMSDVDKRHNLLVNGIPINHRRFFGLCVLWLTERN